MRAASLERRRELPPGIFSICSVLMCGNAVESIDGWAKHVDPLVLWFLNWVEAGGPLESFFGVSSMNRWFKPLYPHL
jgi:hypothetical protein